MKQIASADNPRFKRLLKLVQSSRERRKAGRSLIEGVHLIQAYRDNLGPPEQIVVSKSAVRNQEILQLISEIHGSEALVLSDALFRALSSLTTPAGVVAIIKTPARPALPNEAGPCVLLEDIQDPGNLGSILRSTAAAGIREVHLSKGCVHCWSPRVLRAGMGAHFMLAIHENADLASFMHKFQGRVIAATQRASQSIFDTDLTGNVGLLFGNEGSGLSSTLLAAAKIAACIPMLGKTESLNAAAAAAICLFERVRQIAVREKRS